MSDATLFELTKAVSVFAGEAERETTNRFKLIDEVQGLISELETAAYCLGHREPVSITVPIGDCEDPEARAIFAIMHVMDMMAHWAGGVDVTECRKRVAAYVQARWGSS